MAEMKTSLRKVWRLTGQARCEFQAPSAGANTPKPLLIHKQCSIVNTAAPLNNPLLLGA